MNSQAQTLADQLASLLDRKANPAKAPAMEAYLRHQFRFFGVSSPDRREVIASLKPLLKKLDAETVARFVKLCWEHPNREMQYGGMELFALFATNPGASVIDTCEWIITHKSWWDTVDYIAPNIVGRWLKVHPDEIVPVTSRWIDSGNLWLQRSCLLFQLKYKTDLDFPLLSQFILQLNHHPDFFIRKAIGWSLRSYARQNSEAVKQFVDATPLHPLSRREALKHYTSD